MTAKAKATSTSVGGTDSSRDARRMAAVFWKYWPDCGRRCRRPRCCRCRCRGIISWNRGLLCGFVAACETRPRGRQPDAVKLETLRRDNERLQRDLTRQQSLVRLTQRTVGVAASPPVKVDARKRKRKPMVRALRRVEQLRDGEEANGVAASAASPLASAAVS